MAITEEEQLPGATSIPNDAHKNARLRTTYSSFGGDGVTATANAYGHLLQITQYFGNKPSGFIAVNLDKTEEPYFVKWRAYGLQQQSIDPGQGMRLLLQKPADNTSAVDIWETNPKTLSMPEKAPPPVQASLLAKASLSVEPSSDPDRYDVPVPRPQWVNESEPGSAVRFVHNRWPCFSTKTPAFDISIQYVISDKTVYQTYTFKLCQGTQIFFSEIPKIAINTNLLLRDLDFTTKEKMKKYDPESPKSHYSSCITNDGYSVARMRSNYLNHKHNDSQNTNKSDQNIIALFISPFVNERPQQLSQPHRPEDLDYYFVTPDEQAWNDLIENQVLEITLAYTLRLITSSTEDIATSPVSEADLKKAKEQINKDSPSPVSITGNKRLDFALSRNLEHILSVCSIPIEKVSDEIDTIALTCGDISGHRVVGKASFYAFQFLLLAYQHFDSKVQESASCKLEKCTCENYCCNMRSRIFRVCRGHLEWLFGEDEGFTPHKWATGKAIAKWESNPTLSKKSVVDASFSIIKAADFYRIAASSQTKQDTIDDFKSNVSDWIEDLHQNNQENEYVFPHSTEDLPQQFQLSDHAIIWRALKSLESIELNSELRVNTRPGRRKTSYSSRKIQDSIFKKFITDCTQLDERLMATSRSLSETSFLLHIEDTATLSAMKMGLFDLPKREELVRRLNIESTDEPGNSPTTDMPVGTSSRKSDTDLADPWRNKNESWVATIDSQKLHEDNDEDNWDHPLQYALAMILSANGIPINSQTPLQMYRYAQSILLQSSSPNGLFPGQLDENKDPALFEDDDAYWHTSFEVPFVLWETKKLLPRTEESSSDETSSASLHRRNSSDASLSGAGFVRRYEPFTESPDLGPNYEWLYKKPKFFGFHIDLSSKAIEKFCEDHRRNGDKSSETINRAVKAAQSSETDIRQDFGYIIDISGVEYTKMLGQRDLLSRIYSLDKIRSFIGGVRDSTNAKKRFFHFYRANLDIALNCYLASSEEEEISSFFDKHSSYSKYFFEDTTAIFNKWVTELHLSFYQVVTDDHAFQTIPWTETFKFPDSTGSENDKRVGRAVMSFRFDGDIFDHYWTCHFFDHNPQWLSDSDALTSRQLISAMPISGTIETDPWQQRRVLELLLFDMILQEMIKGTKGILEEIMTSVLKSSQSNHDGATNRPTDEFSEIDASTLLNALEVLSKVDSNTFASKNELWNKFQRILQVIEDDLKESLTMIALWTDREGKRDIIKATWTPRKEQRYQGAISRLKLLNSHKIHELRRCGANVASFNMLLTRRLEVMRNDLDTKSNVDIRLFTYVTVVFLPVSFATGVFSMSGAPTRELLGSMATTACIALLITVIALLNAKVLGAELFGPIFNGIRPLSEAALRPIFRFFTGLIYLILLSIISILPNQWIYFLQSRIEKAASEQSSLQTSANEGFIDRKVKQIRNKVKEIEKEIGEEERNRRKKQEEEKKRKKKEEEKRRREEEEEEKRREEEEKEEEITREREEKERKSREKEEGVEERREEVVSLSQADRDSAAVGGRTGDSSDDTVASSNRDVDEETPRNIFERIRHRFGGGRSRIDRSGV